MNLAVTAPGWLAALLMLLLLLAAVEDAWRMRISNVTILAILAGAVVAAMLAGPTFALWQNLALFAGLLALGTPLFALGKVGGGDVKLIAVSGAWFDLRGGLLMLICVLIAGGVLALLILALRTFDWSENVRRRIWLLKAGSGIPYGVAIAAGSMLATSCKWA